MNKESIEEIENNDEIKETYDKNNNKYKKKYCIFTETEHPTQGWFKGCYICETTTAKKKIFRIKDQVYHMHLCYRCQRKTKQSKSKTNLLKLEIESIKKYIQNKPINSITGLDISTTTGPKTTIIPLSSTQF